MREYYEGNITPGKNTIFVFGSNTEGRHGKGAALIAWMHFGAKYHEPSGLHGNSYAIITKDLSKGLRSISEDCIIKQISEMYKVAETMPNYKFKIAYRNTDKKSLNGYTGYEMIRMFNEAGRIPNNVIFSKEWYDTSLLNIH